MSLEKMTTETDQPKVRMEIPEKAKTELSPKEQESILNRTEKILDEKTKPDDHSDSEKQKELKPLESYKEAVETALGLLEKGQIIVPRGLENSETDYFGRLFVTKNISEDKPALQEFKNWTVTYFQVGVAKGKEIWEADFSKCCLAEVKSPIFDKRNTTYEKADEALAQKWNIEKHDGRTNWTSKDIENYRKEHHYTWHEKMDLQTLQLVPTKIHQAYVHMGGSCLANILVSHGFGLENLHAKGMNSNV